MNKIYISALIFLFTGYCGNAFSQKKQQAIEISKENKIKYVKAGRKLTVWSKGIKYKIKADSIGQDKIFTKDTIFNISDIDVISIRLRGTQISGIIIGIPGLIFTSVGTLMVIKGLQEDAAFAVAFGLAIDIIGIPPATAGTVLFFAGKKYKKSKGWKFRTVQLE